MSDDKFSISLSRSEALVLFDLRSRYSETDRIEIEDQAEQRVLWDVCCLLESGLSSMHWLDGLGSPVKVAGNKDGMLIRPK